MSKSFFIVISILYASHFNSCKNNESSNKKTYKEYKCLPCGYECDKEIFTKSGICSKCNMRLVPADSIKFKTVQPSAICDYITKHNDVILLDVRTKEEFEGKANPNFGTLKNAINIPVQELQSRLSELAAYKKKDIIVFCSHSHRSPQAAYLLNENGFNNVTNMEGGMSVLTDKSCIINRTP